MGNSFKCQMFFCGQIRSNMARIVCVLLASLHLFVNVSGRTAVKFVFYSDKRNWSEAGAICTQNGGQLANIEDNATLAAVSYFAKSSQWQQNVTDSFWIGLHKSSEKSLYKWSNCSDLTDVANWAEPEIVDHYDRACVRVDHNTLQWFPSSCDDRLQYLCQFMSGPCTYVSYTSRLCFPSHVTEKIVSVATESECQRSCDTAVNEDGDLCWAYYYPCILLHTSDPFFCEEEDRSVITSDIFGDRFMVRRCFYFEVNDTVEQEDSGVTTALLDCSESNSQETVYSGTEDKVETTESSVQTFVNAETGQESDIGTELTTVVDINVGVETNVESKTGNGFTTGTESDTGTEPDKEISNVEEDSIKESKTGTESHTKEIDVEQKSIQTLTNSAFTIPGQVSVSCPSPAGLHQNGLSQSGECIENTIISSLPVRSNEHDISPSPSLHLSLSIIPEIEPSRYLPQNSLLPSQTQLENNEEYDKLRRTDSVFLSSVKVNVDRSSLPSDSEGRHMSYTDFLPDIVHSHGLEELGATSQEALPAINVTSPGPAIRTRHVICTCISCSSRANDSHLEEVLVDHLKIDKASLSSTRRKLTTAPDNRRSAQTIGCVGVIFVSLAMCCMVLSDIMSLIGQRFLHMKVDLVNA